jgi:hypothetical protein
MVRSWPSASITAGALFGLLHVFFGARKIVVRDAQLPLVEEPPLRCLGDGQGRGEAPVFLHPAVGHLRRPKRVPVGHRKTNQSVLQAVIVVVWRSQLLRAVDRYLRW